MEPNVPPHDSKSEPWWHEQRTKARSTATATPKAKAPTKGKSKPEGAWPADSSIARASLEVSLDNADTVIDGAPGSRAGFCALTWVFPPYASGPSMADL